MSGFRRGHTAAAKLTPLQVVELRRKYNDGYTQGQLAREYKLSVVQIGRICRGEAWQQFQQEPHPDEIQHSAAKLDQLLGLDAPAHELSPEEVKRLNKDLAKADPVEEALPSIEDVLNRRGGQPNVETGTDTDESSAPSDGEGLDI